MADRVDLIPPGPRPGDAAGTPFQFIAGYSSGVSGSAPGLVPGSDFTAAAGAESAPGQDGPSTRGGRSTFRIGVGQGAGDGGAGIEAPAARRLDETCNSPDRPDRNRSHRIFWLSRRDGHAGEQRWG